MIGRTYVGAAMALAAMAVILMLGGGSAARADLSLQAASATITVDGDNADWAAISGLALTLEQFEIPPGSDWDYDPVAPKNATLKVATDAAKVYVLLEVTDTYDYVATNHDLSPALAVMFRIDAAAGPHMGSGPDDFEAGLGKVDIWHWELDCGPGVPSGGGDPGSGNDPDCNLDDEYATDPETREDDGKPAGSNTNAENSIAGVWKHTAAAIGGAGKWIFEMSRPLNSGDSQDAQFTPGGTAYAAVAYWDPKESSAGWSDAGHLVSADAGWVAVSLPAGATATPTATPAGATATPTATVTAAAPPKSGGPSSGDGGTSTIVYVLAALGGAAVLAGAAAASRRLLGRKS
ncbi:MAG: hypothetical protein HYY03_04355 [Chloroflexi bacterium]|nr:hypothetical protein [Chloroflexota bacterium]